MQSNSVRWFHGFSNAGSAISGTTNTGANARNVFIGINSGNTTMTGTSLQAKANVGVGHFALNALTTGRTNVAIGWDTLTLCTTGDANMAIGAGTLNFLVGGSSNVAVGVAALTSVVGGGSNVGIGDSAGSFITGGSNNTFIGSGADATGDYTNAIAIGESASVDASNKTVIGNSSTTVAWIYGAIFSVTAGPTAVPVITGSGTTNVLPLFTDGPNGVIGNSQLSQDATYATLTNRTFRLSSTTTASIRFLTNGTGLMDLEVASTGATTYTAGGTNPKHTFNDAFIITNDASSTLSIRRTSGGSVYGTAIAASSTGTTFTCNVDTGVPSTGFMFIPASAWSTGKYFQFTDDAGNGLFFMDVATKALVFASATQTGGAMVEFGNVNSSISSTFSLGVSLQPRWGTTAGTTIGGFTNAAVAGYFGASDNVTAGTVMTTLIGGAFENNNLAVNRNHVSVVGGLFRAIGTFSGTTACAHGNVYGWLVKANGSSMNQTATNNYGGYIEGTTAATPAFTNIYGLYVEEQTQAAATIKNGIFVASATAGYKAVVLGSQSNWLAWETATTFSLNATTVIFKADADHTAKNILTDTTTGTKIGTATTQKLSLWNATPIVQPTAAVAAATFVANTSAIVDDSATFDGYTIGQVVKALRNIGVLA